MSLAFQEYLHELKTICGVKEMLPESCTLSGFLPDDGHPPASGYVYEATLDGSKVRIQRVRMCPEADPQKVKEVRPRRHIFSIPRRQQIP